MGMYKGDTYLERERKNLFKFKCHHIHSLNKFHLEDYKSSFYLFLNWNLA